MSEPHWQYSLRSLLILTTIVSICLAIGVHFAGFMVVFVAVGAVQVVALLSADWLIRPRNRRALAFVTAGSWIVMGSGSLIICLGLAFNAFEDIVSLNGSNATRSMIPLWVMVVILAVAAVLCYAAAALRWRKLSADANYVGLSDTMLKR